MKKITLLTSAFLFAFLIIFQPVVRAAQVSQDTQEEKLAKKAEKIKLDKAKKAAALKKAKEIKKAKIVKEAKKAKVAKEAKKAKIAKEIKKAKVAKEAKKEKKDKKVVVKGVKKTKTEKKGKVVKKLESEVQVKKVEPAEKIELSKKIEPFIKKEIEPFVKIDQPKEATPIVSPTPLMGKIAPAAAAITLAAATKGYGWWGEKEYRYCKDIKEKLYFLISTKLEELINLVKENPELKTLIEKAKADFEQFRQERQKWLEKRLMLKVEKEKAKDKDLEETKAKIKKQKEIWYNKFNTLLDSVKKNVTELKSKQENYIAKDILNLLEIIMLPQSELPSEIEKD